MTRRSAYAGAIALLAGALMITAPAAAQRPAPASTGPSSATPRLPNGHPDLSGMWVRTEIVDTYGAPKPQASNEYKEVQEADSTTRLFPTRRCAPNQKGCQDQTNETNDFEFTFRTDPNRPKYRPEFWDKVQELDYNTNFLDPMFRCQPLGVPRIGPPTKIMQTADEVVFLYTGTNHDYRVIPTDARPHDPNAFPSFFGDAVAHWDGDTLVVDVTAFNDITWIASGIQGGGGGYFHTYDMHVVERFRREGDTLHYQATVEDPNVLLEPWTMNARDLTLNADAKAVVREGLPCHDYDEAITVSRVRH